jgi:hypothetical protein
MTCQSTTCLHHRQCHAQAMECTGASNLGHFDSSFIQLYSWVLRGNHAWQPGRVSLNTLCPVEHWVLPQHMSRLPKLAHMCGRLLIRGCRWYGIGKLAWVLLCKPCHERYGFAAAAQCPGGASVVSNLLEKLYCMQDLSVILASATPQSFRLKQQSRPCSVLRFAAVYQVCWRSSTVLAYRSHDAPTYRQWPTGLGQTCRSMRHKLAACL